MSIYLDEGLGHFSSGDKESWVAVQARPRAGYIIINAGPQFLKGVLKPEE
jgi:hypothetical protein